MEKLIQESIKKHKEAVNLLEANHKALQEIASLFIATLKKKGKIIFMGNGGSAADAQHLAAEFVGRFNRERNPLPALALSTNTSTITAVSNDFGFEDIFLRQIEALGAPQDLVVGISTSGQSLNIIKAVQRAKELGMKTVGFLGKDGGDLKEIIDVSLIIPSFDTPRIQEIHILVGHIICAIVEERLT
ncbi:MAG: D-sedoheptulose 7-phosphate isomerase [Candidatus Omnitrophota bacterium]|nr:MAG: D-sedoheptulose 7-phosphate isomerase [Candidatus Omnitrophota bacterium]